MGHAHRIPLAAAVLVAAVVVSPAFSVAPRSGRLVKSFGLEGRVITDVSGGFDEAYGVAIQEDGRVVVVGAGFFSRDGTSFVLARYLADGRLDPSFGAGGIVRTDFTAGSDVARAVALQTDGRIVAAGFTFFGRDFAVARYLADGRLDPAFGDGGKVVVDFNRGPDMAYDVAIQPDGRILVVGDTGIGRQQYNFALVRLRRDGTLDTSFGDGGLVSTDFSSSIDGAYDVTLQPDGRIVVAGRALSALAVARYRRSGRLDRSFGDGGRVITRLAGAAEATAVGVQPDGRIVVGGSMQVGPNETDMVLVRYRADGAPDPSFGDAGLAQTDLLAQDFIGDLVITLDGSILAAGVARPPASDFDRQFVLVRYISSGGVDRAFGRRGVVMTDFSGDADSANDLALTADGGVVVVGRTTTDFAAPTANFDFALARYHHRSIFADGFESGDTGAWDQTKGPVEVVSPGLRQSGHALKVIVEDRGRKSFVRSRHPQAERSMRISLQLDIDATDPGPVRLELLRASGDGVAFQLFLERLRRVPTVSLWAWEDSGSVRPVGAFVVRRRRSVRLTIDWCAASGADRRDGLARLLRQRRVEGEARDLDNASLRVRDVKLGLVSGSRGASGGSIRIDDYSSAR